MAKAVAAVATNEGQLTDYLEVIGRGQGLVRVGLPCIAVPTTAGTGAEVTRNAVIDVPSHATKVSLRGEYLLPRVALVDPRLTLSVPKAVTAATGFDALAQVVEPFVSNRANPMTDALARAGIRLAARSLRRAYHQGSDITARSDMALVSLWGGMCLANARLGAVHGLAGPIGGMFHLAHGVLCAALLGPAMRANVAALRRQTDGRETLERYAEIARLVTDNDSASAEDGIAWVEQLASELGVSRLGPLDVLARQRDELVDRALRASSMQGNPVRLTPADILAILERTFSSP
jgi:alcohol dehydrogenase class IV